MNKLWRNLQLHILLVLGLFVAQDYLRADTVESGDGVSSPATRFEFDFGGELMELYYSDRPYARNNYTVFFGQRFTTPAYSNWGWRVLAIDTHMTEEHTSSAYWISGNTRGLTDTLSVNRLYLDYYPRPFVKTAYFEVIPTISAGAGTTGSRFGNSRSSLSLIEELGPSNFLVYREIARGDRQFGELYAQSVDSNFGSYLFSAPYRAQTEVAHFQSPNAAFAARLKFLFFSLVFLECQVDLFATTNPVPTFWVGDAYIHPPQRFGVFGWTNFGVRRTF